jgi:NAD(P)H dehydrogenase (quinone)
MASTLLVTGASGHLGRLVLDFLTGPKSPVAKGTKIIATSRSPDKLKEYAQRGVDVRKGDFDDDIDALAKTFAGAERMLMISTDSFTGPLSRTKQHTRALEAAAKTGTIKHVIYTGVVDAKTSPLGLAEDHAATEVAIENSAFSANHTILRNNFYAELLLGSLPPALASGQLYSAAGDGTIAYVARADCAKAAAHALASSFSGKRIVDVTGPDALSHKDVARLATELTGKPVAVVPVSVEQLAEGMKKAGLPPPVADLYAGIDVAVAKGALQRVGDGVRSLTGDAPQSVQDFLKANLK